MDWRSERHLREVFFLRNLEMMICTIFLKTWDLLTLQSNLIVCWSENRYTVYICICFWIEMKTCKSDRTRSGLTFQIELGFWLPIIYSRVKIDDFLFPKSKRIKLSHTFFRFIDIDRYRSCQIGVYYHSLTTAPLGCHCHHQTSYARWRWRLLWSWAGQRSCPIRRRLGRMKGITGFYLEKFLR